VRWPAVPSHNTVTPAWISSPRPVRTPTTFPSFTTSDTAAVSGSTIAPPASACSPSQRPSSDNETTTLPWFRIVGGVGIRIARARVSR
jgi:hypothetical protein